MLSKVKGGEKRQKLRGEVISRIVEMYVKVASDHEFVHGQFEYTVEKENSKECGVVCMRNMVNDSSRHKKIRSHGNVDFKKDGENSSWFIVTADDP